ncbi:uncharacterized protein LOC135848294 [Planococcus citri]|uniref:uncharacterized protein LOC135848294 n=1 Tax=Planococcus citri TaxID=170843 RepID=UPI0031F7BAA6
MPKTSIFLVMIWIFYILNLEAHITYVKAPLAPEEDFLFNTWKLAARQNILTAPTLRDLQPQWQALETFIRKVSQIIDVVAVTTGVSGNLSNFPNKQKMSSSKHQLRVPLYFWKAVSLESFPKDETYSYGIVFIMPNVQISDQVAKPGLGKLCSAFDIVELGWTFLKDNQFERSGMYGCPLNNNISMWLRGDGEEVEREFQDFNLNSVLALKLNEKGDRIVKEVNVVEEMGKFKKVEGEDI